ncbi:hypothetical protein EWM64_g897 [Hericium alpestre]|uniref:DRBM domain-containing protein n=1 Tax=Hericium alpestre TaxID=135208 RepID=A0A4Z0AA41_9AGAM|nr:hypothetical protein EWM64_g897 [Hericium alpestre]
MPDFNRSIHNWGRENGVDIRYSEVQNGPANNPTWTVTYIRDGYPGTPIGQGSAPTKKEAKQHAAEQACIAVGAPLVNW